MEQECFTGYPHGLPRTKLRCLIAKCMGHECYGVGQVTFNSEDTFSKVYSVGVLGPSNGNGSTPLNTNEHVLH